MKVYLPFSLFFRFFKKERLHLIGMILLAVSVLQCMHPGAKDVPPQDSMIEDQPWDYQKSWPHTGSDLQPDPSLITGRLDNGVRFILKENRTPLDRVSMHLYVQTGSLSEKDDEQGIAHFLEHMMFNGSAHFEPGEMVKFFQRIGMQFGPDANAHTGFSQTVFDVLLPKGNEQSIGEGLLVLRDYAQGALLLPEETDKERKVILAESRSRDSADFRVLKESFRFEMPGGLIPSRFPIGQKEVIENIDAGMLRRFYETWYRPDRLLLVMVGDFKADQILPRIDDAFGDLRARAPAKTSPSLGRFSHSGIKPFYHFESEMGTTTVRIETIEQVLRPGDSMAWQHHQLLQDLADGIVQQRLEALLQNPKTDFTEADIGSGVYLQRIRFAEISAQCKPQHWRQTLETLEQELRRAMQFGFTQAEVDRVQRAYRAQLARDLEESNTRDSAALARHIMAAFGSWQVFQSPQQRMDMLSPMLEKVTAEQLHHFFIKTWNAPHRLILVTGNANLSALKMPVEDQILSVYRKSTETAVAPPEEKDTMAFPYLPVPPDSGVVQNRHAPDDPVGDLEDDLGITRISFANGVQLILKPTRFKANQVMMALSFGNGKASEPVQRPGLAYLSEAVINASGFGQMDRTELETALAGNVARIDLETREDRFVVKGETLPAELPLLVQLLYTFVKDPGYRPEAYHLVLKRYEQQYQSMQHTIEGAMRIQGQRFLAGGDSRFGLPDPDQLQQLSLDMVRDWFGAQLERYPLELSVVGDIDRQEVIDLVGRYFGSLPPREDIRDHPERPAPSFPEQQSLELDTDSNIPKSMVVIAYPTDDFWDISQTRRLNILADIFTERLREDVREKLGAAYSPYAYNRSYRAYPGYGVFQVHLTVAPRNVPMMIDEVRKISDRLRQNSIDDDEFRRALDPELTGIKDLRQANEYWLNSVLIGASRYPVQLEWARSIEKDYAAIRKKEVAALAREYLDNSKAAVIVINSGGDR